MLGDGEYVAISTCVKMPYNFHKIIKLLHSLRKHKIEYKKARYLQILPNKVTYDLVWEGDYDFFSHNHFKEDELEKNVLSSIDLILKDDFRVRLQINFLDELSYEICIYFNYTELVEEGGCDIKARNNLLFIEDIGLVLFKEVKPIYGLIAIENSVCGIESILNNDCILPIDKAFYNTNILDIATPYLDSIIDKAIYKNKIQNCGLYFRKTEVDDYKLIETVEERKNIIKINKYLRSCF